MHEFERLNIKLIYVFDGHEINLKRTRRALRRELKRRLQARLAASTTWQEYDKVTAKLTRVNGQLIKAFCDWVRAKFRPGTFCLLGAPFEADAQLTYLEMHGYTQGTLSPDSDIYFYEGSRNLFSGFNTRSKKKYRSVINRASVDPYFASLSGEALRTLSCFMGTDYIDHLRGVGWFDCTHSLTHTHMLPPPPPSHCAHSIAQDQKQP